MNTLGFHLEKLTQRKKALDALRPYDPVLLAKLRESLDIEWTYNSNAIEGNTLTLNETRLVLLEGVTIGGKPLKDHLEAINHKKAIDFLESAVKPDAKITENLILQMHALILREIDDKYAGVYRDRQVYISGSNYYPPPAQQIPGLMEKFVAKTNQCLAAVDHPVVIASAAHFDFVEIHPFVDGNGRVARLLMNLILMHFGYPPAIVLMSRRRDYIESIVQIQNHHNFVPFNILLAEALEYTMEKYLGCLKRN